MNDDMSPQDTSRIPEALEQMRRLRSLARKPLVMASLTVLGLALLVFLLIGSLDRLPPLEHPAWWAMCVLALVTTPATVAANSSELRTIAACTGTEISWTDAFTTSLVASLANLLPIPGAVAIRTTALVRRGAAFRAAAEANLLAALVWLGSTGLLAALALLTTSDRRHIGAALSMIAGGGTGLVLMRVSRLAGQRIASRLLLVEMTTVLISATRVVLAFELIRKSIGFADAIVISSATVLAALVGFFPGGLGIRELLSSVLAAATGTSGDAAILATVVDRVAAQVGLILVYVFMALLPNGPGAAMWNELRGRKPSTEDN